MDGGVGMNREELDRSQDAPAGNPKILKENFADVQGKEVGLSVASRSYLVFGFVGILACILVATITGKLIWIAIGIGCMFIGVPLYILFGALSEIIRLLKTLAGLPYTGRISGTTKGTIHICSECGSLIWPDSTVCDKCGASFEEQQSESTSQISEK
jgi:hypothetical protein